MGIFSKFQIKDIKSKILGGKVKHKAEVPAIAVIPPTPSVKSHFSFPVADSQKGSTVADQSIAKSSRSELSRQRSSSLPDCLDQETAAGDLTVEVETENEAEIVKSYLKLPPKSSRRKRRRKHRGRRAISCPDDLSILAEESTSHVKHLEGFAKSSGPNTHCEDVLCGYDQMPISEIRTDDILPQLKTENQKFGPEFDTQTVGKCTVIEEIGLEKNQIVRSCEHDNNNGISNSRALPSSPTDAEESKENTSNCFDDSEKSELDQGEIRRRVLKLDRRKPEARWSLDLEKLRSGCSDNSLESNDSEMKWDGHQASVSPKNNGKSLLSTWSLDFDSKALVDENNVGRAYSDVNFSGSPALRNRSESANCDHVMFNAKSLDLEFVTRKPNPESSETDITYQRSTSLKRGISDYVGRFNGIVSKFSTWSLDIELNRKRSLDGELDDSNRAQSDNAIADNVDSECPEKEGRSLSYHSLLYDIDEASRYQIYQPTVYEIGDEPGGGLPEGTHTQPKPGHYSNSMKFLSKQFGHLCENGKSLYNKQRHVFMESIKQRERELKAIADKQAQAKQGTEKPPEQFFKPKPKPPQRHRSNSHKRHTQQAKILAADKKTPSAPKS
eukprot:Seg996.6 transcript_id=Seg996.6/GoldUCD/mRNA.D3Y31 product="hypothetical protein" protein_id=Seg996.6/GoldUCD/D3Y31